MEEYGFYIIPRERVSDLQHCVELHLFMSFLFDSFGGDFSNGNVSIFAFIFPMLVFKLKQIIGLFEAILSVQGIRLFFFSVIVLSFVV